MKKSSGFTLIELVIVMLVVAILAAIALPSYIKQTRKSRRSEVESSIQQAALLEERYRADCTTYANFGDSCATNANVTMPAWSTVYSGSYYGTPTFTVAPDAVKYTIQVTANATGGQNKDSAMGTDCSTLSYALASGVVTKSPSQCW